MPKKKTYRKRRHGEHGPHLSDNDRANILIEKDLRREKNQTNEDIAIKLDIGLDTVVRTTKSSASPEVLDLYEKKKARLAEKALDVTMKALEKGEILIDKASDPKALAGIAQMGRFADTVHRLERGDPTQISQSVGTETHALEFIRFMMGKMTQAAAIEAFKNANLEPLVPEIRKNDILARIASGELRLLAP